MKKLFSLIALLIVLATGSLFAQQGIIRTQGHPRQDIMATAVMPKSAAVDPDFTEEDIVFWVGGKPAAGKNWAALVIDWYDGKGNTLVWGYTWPAGETRYGIDMLEAVAKADPRVYVLVMENTDYGNVLGGMGYDTNNSKNLCLKKNNSTFCADSNGMVITGTYDFDSYLPVDATDRWQSGWMKGYWSYHISDTGGTGFEYSQLGASSRILENGSWDGWGYQLGWESWTGMSPRAPYMAAPRP